MFWSWLLLLFGPKRRLTEISEDATVPNAILLVLELHTCDSLFCVNQNAPNAFGQNSENQIIKDKEVLGRQTKAESSFAMISWCYLMVIKQIGRGS